MKFPVPVILFFVCACLSVAAMAHTVSPGEDGSISGYVVDSSNEQALEYANVVLFRQQDSAMLTGTITDPTGKFQLSKLPYGDFYLVVNFIGYHKKIIHGIHLDKSARSVNMDKLILEPAVAGLKEVEITGERPAVEYKIDKKLVNVAKNLNASGGTAVDALQNVPSVTVDVDGNVSVRGSSNFTVLVDGRPSALNGNDLLKQTPASAIENIEVITNPSAKYDPDGTAGIINLIMKKQKLDGVNGIVNASASTNQRYSGDFTINHRVGKFSSFIGSNLSDNRHQADQEIFREDFFMDTTRFLHTKTLRQHRNNGRSVKGGVDYALNGRITLSLSGEYGYFGFKRTFPNKNRLYTEPAAGDDFYYINNNEFDIKAPYGSANLNYQHKFGSPGHELNLNVFASDWDGRREESRMNYLTDTLFQKTGLINASELASNDVRRQNSRGKLDYTLPLGEKSKLESGLQFDRNQADYDYKAKRFCFETQNWVLDSVFSNAFSFEQLTYAAYLTYSNATAGFEYQLGLRYETMDRTIRQLTNNEEYSLDFENFFPTFHISRQMAGGNQLQLSYSKRINRPQEWMLNPFPMYADGTFLSTGNARLKPDFTSSFELNYMKTFKKSSLTCEVFYRQTDHNISQVFKLNQEGVLFSTFDNTSSVYQHGLEVNVNIALLKWLNVNAIASYYRQKLDAYEAYNTDASNASAYNIQFIPRVTLPSKTILQVVAYYFSEQTFAQGKGKAFGQLDASARHEFFNKKLTAGVRANNLFRLAKNRFVIEGQDFYVNQVIEPQGNVFTFSVSYKINNYTRSQRRIESVEMDAGGM